MPAAPTLTLDLRDHPVTLHHPGAEGVRFHDAVFTVRNDGTAPVEDIRLRLAVVQDNTVLLDASVDPGPVGMAARLAPGEEGTASLFRLLQQEVLGFGSKVNLFGYKAVLNWAYRVTAEPLAEGAATGRSASRTWQVRWAPAVDCGEVVEVEIAE